MADDATATAVASRASRFSRIAAIARRDLESYAATDGSIFTPGAAAASSSCSSVESWEPPWIARRRKREMDAMEVERNNASVRQMVEMAMGIGQQVDAMGRQMEEQNRQLKALSAGHCAQTNIQQQLLNLLAELQAKQQQQEQQQSKSSRRHPFAYSPPTHGQTPQEYHTLTWLHSNHRQAGKHYRHPAHGLYPLRRSPIHSSRRSPVQSSRISPVRSSRRSPVRSSRRSPVHNDHHKFDSGSDRTRTTFGGTRRRGYRRSPPVSVPTEPPPSHRSLEKERKPSPKKARKIPLVAVLYEKCKRRAQKKSARKRAKLARQAPSAPSAPSSTEKHKERHDNHHNHSHRDFLEGKRPEEHPTNRTVKQRLEDRILDSMLAVKPHEDQHWLVSEKDDTGMAIQQAIFEELTKQSNHESTPRCAHTFSSASHVKDTSKFDNAVENTMQANEDLGDGHGCRRDFEADTLEIVETDVHTNEDHELTAIVPWINSNGPKESLNFEASENLQTQEEPVNERNELILDILMDELAEEISVELLCFCNEFVEDIYASEFIPDDRN